MRDFRERIGADSKPHRDSATRPCSGFRAALMTPGCAGGLCGIKYRWPGRTSTRGKGGGCGSRQVMGVSGGSSQLCSSDSFCSLHETVSEVSAESKDVERGVGCLKRGETVKSSKRVGD